MSCKKMYVCPSFEIITEEEEPWIVCASVTIEGGNQSGLDGDEGKNEEIPSKYTPYSSTMFFDDGFEDEDY